ncbi:MAG: polysaccharide export outer membrane protein [Paracoccaceae bacterium]|jgi:polysaccharide export outer membrane protein
MRLVSLCLILGAVALSGCAAVPKSGPDGSAVLAAAAPGSGAAPYALRRLDAEMIVALADARGAEVVREDAGSRLQRAAPVHGQTLRPGDLVSVTIWEAVNGGLFSAAAEDGPKSTRLPPQRVDAQGMIAAPYAGRLRAAGRTPDQVAQALVAALAGKAIDPQALVSVLESPGDAVTVVGDAAEKAGRVPLMGVGERLLDVVAAAGGVKTPSHEALVRLTRGDRSAEAWLDRILRQPDQNVAMLAGDTVALMAQNRSFTVFGAANRPILTAFPRPRVTLDEALAVAGGLDDERAEPSAVFVFRNETAPALGPVVYNLDLSRPEAFFLARGFEIRDKDILYVANSPITDLRKVLSLIGAALNPVRGATSLSTGF